MLRSSKGRSIPLKSQVVKLSVENQNASFTIVQEYYNSETNPIEAYYTFPTPSGASVYHFEAIADDGSVIKCVIKEKEQAKRDYDTAMRRGDSAYYMERQSSDVFSVTVGNLAPESGVKICIKYVVELQDEVDYLKLRVNIPLTIMPRYTPSAASYSNPSYIAATRAAMAAQNTEKINGKPYDLSIHGDIHMTDGIKNVDFKTHRAKLSQMQETSIHFDMENLSELNQDIVITIERNDSKSFANTYVLNSESGQEITNPLYKYATIVKFIPDFSKLPPVDLTKVHYVILLDNSGSMSGPNIEICKKAAQQFVALLPIGCTFDVYSFNDNYAKFLCDSDDINQRKVKAGQWIERISAGGGTEVLPVLREIYKSIKELKKSGILVCISDGGVTNTDDVLKTVKQNQNVSVFTIGVGSSVSQALIQGMAEQGNGHAEFIGSGDTVLITKVQSQLKKAQDTLRKRQDQYEIEVNTLGGKHRILPESNPVLYQGSNNYMYVFSEYKPVSITYTEKGSDESESYVQTLVPSDASDPDSLTHRIAGIKLIEHLQANELPLRSGSTFSHMRPEKTDTTAVNPSQNEIIEASKILSVLSKYTAFIGVKINKNKIMDEMHPRIVPLQESKHAYMLDEILLVDSFCPPVPASASAAYDSRIHIVEGFCPPASAGYPTKEYARGGTRGGARGVKEVFDSDFDSDNESGLLESDDDISYTRGSQESHGVSKKKSIRSGNSLARNTCRSTDTRGFNPNLNSNIDSNLDSNPSQNSKQYYNSVSSDKIECNYIVNLNMTGEYIAIMDEILSCVTNKSLIDTIMKLLVINASKNGSSIIDDTDLIKLMVGDKIRLTAETNSDFNGVYQIISLGSSKEPWVLKKI